MPAVEATCGPPSPVHEQSPTVARRSGSNHMRKGRSLYGTAGLKAASSNDPCNDPCSPPLHGMERGPGVRAGLPYNRSMAPLPDRARRLRLLAAGALLFAAACGSKSPGSPAVSRVDPARVAPGQPAFLIVEGSNFARNASVAVGGQTAAATWVNGSVLTLVVPASLSAGSYDVTVRNPGGPDATLRNGLMVSAGAAPTAASASPPPSATPRSTPGATPTPTPSPSPSPGPTPT